MEPINVLFIIYDLDRGGPELRLLDLAENLPHDVRMFVCVTSTNLTLLDHFKRCNIKIEVVPIVKAYCELSKIREIIRFVRKNRITIVNTYDLKGLIIGLFVKSVFGSRVTLIHNIVDLLHNYSFKQKIALRLLLKVVDKVVSNSSEAKELLGNGFFPKSKIELIHNGVDIGKYNKGNSSITDFKSSLAIPDNAFVIGTVANFREEKEYPFLLKAFKQLLDRSPQLWLVCVGGGPLFDETKELAAEIGVSDRVTFPGYVGNVPDYIAIMNEFVLCSRLEGFPNVLIQAMSMEVPVIATAVGGCREIVDDTLNGFLFNPGDTEKFISRVCTLMENDVLSLMFAQNAKEKVDARFTLSAMIDHYMDYFRNVAYIQNKISQRN